MGESSKVYPPVIEDMSEWPIYKLHDDRANFVKELDDFTFKRILQTHKNGIENTIAKTIYRERIRIKEEPWKVDPPNDRQFWKKMRKQLASPSNDKTTEECQAVNEELLKTIIHRYSEEIVSTFNIPTYRFARNFLKVFFNRLLNTAAGRNLKRIYGTKYHVYERLLTKGDVKKVRKLMKKGTVVVVPTHFSNLDSLLIGYAMDSIVGMPSFLWGAGLNLYNTGYTAYFMNRLGTYRLDRRKKNPIYLEVLKSMSNLSVQRGTNSLFFPGGTRSRSGKLEDKLKMGLLGTVVEGQRAVYQKEKENKIFIVPLVISYHVVLEAKYLIEQHLQKTGKERYLKTKDFNSARKLVQFIWNFFSQPSEITLSFGKPMDVLGNFVDEEGISYDRFGKPVDVKSYFISGGEVTEDLQRESQYTRILADRIVERYHKENIVLTSHLVAFAAFNILKEKNPNLDLYGILRLPTDDYTFLMEELVNVIDQLKIALFEMEKKGRIKLSSQIFFKTEELIQDGIRNLGAYHPEKPLRVNKNKELISDDFKLLYFYHNRLDNYGLDKIIDGKKMMTKQFDDLVMDAELNI